MREKVIGSTAVRSSQQKWSLPLQGITYTLTCKTKHLGIMPVVELRKCLTDRPPLRAPCFPALLTPLSLPHR
jgi:hypothetical protein